MKITKIIGFSLSSSYGDGNVLGQPLGVKSIGFVEVHTDSGLVGLGETYAGVYAPELVAPVAEFIGSRLIGLDPLDPENVAQKSRIPFISRNGLFCSVYSAIDIALWDIAGQESGKPIYELLNPEGKTALRIYASGGSAAMDPQEVAADATFARESGYAGFKMRVGVQDWDIDLKRVAAAKEALGNSTELMIDAIMGTINPPWTLDTATARIEDLVLYKPLWIEEPLHPDDMLNLKKLKDLSILPIATGEALTGWLDFSTYLDMQAINYIQVDPTHCGGITMGKQIIEMADSLGIPTAMHVWGSSAAYAVNAHLALAFSGVEWLEEPMVAFELSSKMSEKPLLGNSDGSKLSLNTPGLGAAINQDLKDQYKMISGSGYKL
jgi:L-alanine-DL-glutamate epimerase-like enolase superfamily enzyme